MHFVDKAAPPEVVEGYEELYARGGMQFYNNTFNWTIWDGDEALAKKFKPGKVLKVSPIYHLDLW